MNNPEYVKVNDELYKINSDFRVVIECNEIAMNSSIGGYEKSLAIIYKLFGEKGLDCKDIAKLFELGMKFISLGNEYSKKENKKEDFELDLSKCKGLIKSSFKYDYKYDPYEKEYLHWYDFYNDLQNLSNDEFGMCCILNRIISVLYKDASKIKDVEERTKLLELREEYKKKYCTVYDKEQTEEQKQSAKDFYKSIGVEW